MMTSKPLLAVVVAVVTATAAAQPRISDRQTAPATPATQGPGAEHALAVYDPQLGRVVLIGGPSTHKQGDRDRVWSWSGTRWELLADSGPPTRVNAAAAYDSHRRKIVVSGGSRKSATDSTWEVVGDSWEGDRNEWHRIEDFAPRDHQSLVTAANGLPLMFGGIPANRTGTWPTDTWELRRDGWTRIAPAGPPGRGRTALAYDTKRREVVLFGGVSAPPGPLATGSGPALSTSSGQAKQPQTFFRDTWIWDGTKWRQVAGDGPPGRYAHAMVFDERAGVVLLYSGSAAHSKAPLTDMWQWDGQRWTEIPLTGPTPGYRYQPIMVYDRARDRTVLYGGLNGSRDDTWEWDGQAWREIKP